MFLDFLFFHPRKRLWFFVKIFTLRILFGRIWGRSNRRRFSFIIIRFTVVTFPFALCFFFVGLVLLLVIEGEIFMLFIIKINFGGSWYHKLIQPCYAFFISSARVTSLASPPDFDGFFHSVYFLLQSWTYFETIWYFTKFLFYHKWNEAWLLVINMACTRCLKSCRTT